MSPGFRLIRRGRSGSGAPRGPDIERAGQDGEGTAAKRGHARAGWRHPEGRGKPDPAEVGFRERGVPADASESGRELFSLPFRSEEPGCRLRITGWRYEDGETQLGRLFADEIGKRLAGGAGWRREEHEYISPAFWRARRVQERGICQKGPRVLIGNGPGVHERGGRAFRVFPVTFGEGRGRYGRHAAWREQIRPERECFCFLGRRWFPRDDGILRGRV